MLFGLTVSTTQLERRERFLQGTRVPPPLALTQGYLHHWSEWLRTTAAQPQILRLKKMNTQTEHYTTHSSQKCHHSSTHTEDTAFSFPTKLLSAGRVPSSTGARTKSGDFNTSFVHMTSTKESCSPSTEMSTFCFTWKKSGYVSLSPEVASSFFFNE